MRPSIFFADFLEQFDPATQEPAFQSQGIAFCCRLSGARFPPFPVTKYQLSCQHKNRLQIICKRLWINQLSQLAVDGSDDLLYEISNGTRYIEFFRPAGGRGQITPEGPQGNLEGPRRVTEARLGRPLKASEVSAYWFRRGLAFMVDRPSEVLYRSFFPHRVVHVSAVRWKPEL